MLAGWILIAVNTVLLIVLAVGVVRVTFQRRSLIVQTARLREQEARVMEVLVDLAKKGQR